MLSVEVQSYLVGPYLSVTEGLFEDYPSKWALGSILTLHDGNSFKLTIVYSVIV